MNNCFAARNSIKAELIALTQALKLAERTKGNIYTDKRYDFAISHVHGSKFQERRLLTAEGKIIKNKEVTLALLEALWVAFKVTIICYPQH